MARSLSTPLDVPGLWEDYQAWFERRRVVEPRFVIDGEYGVDLFDADATLHVLLGRIGNALPNARVKVLCPGPGNVKRRYAHHRRVCASWPGSPGAARALARCHVYMVGGGQLAPPREYRSLLQAARGWIPRVALTARAVQLRGGQTCFYSVGFSHPPTGVVRAPLQRALEQATVVAARDRGSYQSLTSFAERGVVEVADPIESLSAAPQDEVRAVLEYWGATRSDRPLVALALRAGPNPARRAQQVARCATHIIDQLGGHVVFVPLNQHPSDPGRDDLHLGRLVRAELEDDTEFTLIEGAYAPPLVWATLSHVRAIITDHWAASALALREPIALVALTDDARLAAFLRRQGASERGLTEAQLFDAADFSALDALLLSPDNR